ncbi:MAG TPA: hypothetical protein VN661_01345 [Candidatus Acidoferrales bacterium]|nr:hypothetical protein [Candidatus Acidoferrales bacterium]
MTQTIVGNCRRESCARPIPAGLAGERLCVDHFLDEAFVRTDHALESYRQGWGMPEGTLETLLSDALAVVQNLEAGADLPEPGQRDRMLELLLVLANLHECAARQPGAIRRLA